MLKKKITYTDYNDQERTEEFLFNLTKAEVMEMEMSTEGGVATFVDKITAKKDGDAIMNFFKGFILKSYGEKSDDGRKFVKSQALSDAFSQTEAYSDLFMELCTKADAAAAFVRAIIPAPDNPPPKS